MPFVAHKALEIKPIENSLLGLRSVKPGVSYFPTWTQACEDCDFLFLGYRFNDQEMHRLYQNYRDEEYTRLRISYEKDYEQKAKDLDQGVGHLKETEDFIDLQMTHAKILDWGGGDGKNSPYRDWKNFHLYDLNEQSLSQNASSISMKDIEKNLFDVIILSQVLEHVPDPLGLLNQIKKYLSLSGMLYIEVPFEHHQRLKLKSEEKKHWHEHINFFSSRSLDCLAERAGLRLKKKRILEIKPDIFVFQLLLIA